MNTQITRMTAKDFSPELLELYDYYAHGTITKREFLDRAGRYAVGGLTALAILGMLSPNYALAEQVSFNDPDIMGEYVTPQAPMGTARCEGIWCVPLRPGANFHRSSWCTKTGG